MRGMQIRTDDGYHKRMDAKTEVDKHIRNTSQASIYGSEDQRIYINGDVDVTQISGGVRVYRQRIVCICMTFVASLFPMTTVSSALLKCQTNEKHYMLYVNGARLRVISHLYQQTGASRPVVWKSLCLPLLSLTQAHTVKTLLITSRDNSETTRDRKRIRRYGIFIGKYAENGTYAQGTRIPTRQTKWRWPRTIPLTKTRKSPIETRDNEWFWVEIKLRKKHTHVGLRIAAVVSALF